MPYKNPDSAVAKASAKRRHRRYIETHGGYSAVTRGYASRHPDALRNSYYKHEHGVTVAEFEAQIVVQDNRCPIGNHPFGSRGKKKDSPCQDHNHESGENRAILCREHNIGLGCFHDSIEELESAISYLRRYKPLPRG